MSGLRLGVAAVAAPGFDLDHAQQVVAAALEVLARVADELVGDATLLTAADVERALEALQAEQLDHLILLQATFTDAASALRLARAVSAPLLLWGFPEPRTGGPLRLNSFTGLNLAAHALGRAQLSYRWHYAPPQASQALRFALGPARPRRLRTARPGFATAEAEHAAARTVGRLQASRVGVIGRPPDGFDTYRLEPAALRALSGTRIEAIELHELFAAADAVATGRIEALYRATRGLLAGLAEVEQDATRRSLAVYVALEELTAERRLNALAVRCWPEFFTEYGCAACAPLARLADAGTPVACEADVFGALTNLILQEIAEQPALMVNLVEFDVGSDTAVFWRCGLAPLSMAAPGGTPRATSHGNHGLPLLHEFGLRPGRITIARLSQAGNGLKLVIGGGQMLDLPRPFSGTSGVVRFARRASDVLEVIMAEGLEHHYSITYGDHRTALEALARRLDLPVLRLA